MTRAHFKTTPDCELRIADCGLTDDIIRNRQSEIHNSWGFEIGSTRLLHGLVMASVTAAALAWAPAAGCAPNEGWAVPAKACCCGPTGSAEASCAMSCGSASAAQISAALPSLEPHAFQLLGPHTDAYSSVTASGAARPRSATRILPVPLRRYLLACIFRL